MMFFLIIGAITNFNLVFSPSQINIREDSVYTYIYLKGGEFYGKYGNPQIPSFPLSIKDCKKIKNIKITPIKIDTIDVDKPLYPLQYPKIISLNMPFSFVRNKAVYTSKSEYPEKDFSISGHSDVIIYPVHYIPNLHKVLIWREMNIEVTYTPEVYVNKKTYGVEYAIITDDSLISAFQPLAEWEIRKGIRTKIFGLNTILENYRGRDTQEKIRNFIISLFNSGDLKWVLLGGDTDIIPCRRLFAMKSGAGYHSDEDSIPADIYYADLQGNYDLDGDGIYGEVEDSVDLYPDIYVGRAPIHNEIEAENFVNKVIKYETNPDSTIISRYLFLGMILWSDPYTDAGVGKDMIDSLYVPDRIEIKKLYQSSGNETPTSVYQAMNEGYNIVNHDGHGWYSVIGAGTGYLNTTDIDTLKNKDKEGIMYSIGCWVGAMDYDAIAEHWINDTLGGGGAFIGNSRYGWGSPGNPGYGYSDRFDAEFYHHLFSDEENNIGIVLSNAKAHFIPYSREANVYRWHQYEINLLGDPEMPVWTDIPKRITIISDDTINAFNPFHINFLYNDNPIEGLNVCITSPSTTILYKGKTDGTGGIEYTLPSHFTGDSICVVGTGKNYLPIVKWIYVKYARSPDIDTYDRVIPDNQELALPIKIIAPYTIHNVNIFVSSSNDSIEFLGDNPIYIDSINNDTNIIFTLHSHHIYDGEKIPIEIHISSDEINLNREFIFIGGIPILEINPKISSDNIIVKIFNRGHLEAENPIRYINPSEYVNGPYRKFKDILPGDTIFDTVYLTSDTLNLINYTIMGDNFKNKNFQIYLNKENKLLYEDWESNQIWENGGIKDLWRISSKRAHSGEFSAYCGNEQGYYEDGMDAKMISQRIFVNDTATLSFYLYSTFPNYGVDGLYVEIQHNNDVDTLDFIGSGGALKDIHSDWVKYSYALRNYQDSVQLVFEFISDDADTAEGVFIDDIEISFPGVKSTQVSHLLPTGFNVRFLRNPTTDDDYLEVSVVEGGNLEMKVFDILGRLIDRVEMRNLSSGAYFYKFPFAIPHSGLYFMIAKMGQKTSKKKFIFLKGGG